MNKHDGGPCPVAAGTKVRVYFRDGTVRDEFPAGDWQDGRHDWWKHEGEPTDDIIGYDLIDAPAALSEDVLREILAAEIKKRGGPSEYLTMLANKWMEIDSELPPELSAALAALREVERRMKEGK